MALMLPPGPSSDFRIATVDDHPIILSALRLLLEKEPGFAFAGQAATVEEAVRLVSEAQPDAVILDLWLGGNDGVSLVKQLHALAPGVALLCYTMADEALFGLKALRAGARGFISKQESLDEVLEALRIVLAGDRYMSRELQRRAFDDAVTPSALPVELSAREQQVLQLIGRAKSNRDIAEELSVSMKTVSAHRESLKRKLGLRSSSELVRHAVLVVQSGLPDENQP